MDLGKTNVICTTLNEEALMEQLIEESGELVQVLAKRLRILRGINKTPVSPVANFERITEEMADVILCCEVLAHKLNIVEEITEVTDVKLNRWCQRLECK